MLRLNSDTLVFIYYRVPHFIIIPNRESFSSPMIAAQASGDAVNHARLAVVHKCSKVTQLNQHYKSTSATSKFASYILLFKSWPC